MLTLLLIIIFKTLLALTLFVAPGVILYFCVIRHWLDAAGQPKPQDSLEVNQ